MTEKQSLPERSDAEKTPSVDLQERFGTNFREARKSSGLTQVQIAELASMTQGNISDVEVGRVNLTLRTMQLLAKVVGRDVSDLLAETLKRK